MPKWHIYEPDAKFSAVAEADTLAHAIEVAEAQLGYALHPLTSIAAMPPGMQCCDVHATELKWEPPQAVLPEEQAMAEPVLMEVPADAPLEVPAEVPVLPVAEAVVAVDAVEEPVSEPEPVASEPLPEDLPGEVFEDTDVPVEVTEAAVEPAPDPAVVSEPLAEPAPAEPVPEPVAAPALSHDEVVAQLDALKGIGAGLAERLWQAYGDKALEVLRDEPQRAADEIAGLSDSMAHAASLALKTAS